MILFLLLSTISFASTPFGWLPQMLAVTTPEISCESQQEDSLKQRCAQDLCGLAGSVESVFVRDGALNGFTPSAETQAELDRVQRDMDRVTSEWKQKAEAFVRESEKKLSQTNEIDPTRVTGVERLFSSYVSYEVEGDQIRVRTNFPSNIDPVIRQGVEEWASLRAQSVQTDSILRLNLGLDSIEETMVTMRERARIVKESVNRPEISSQLPPQQLNQLKQSLGQIDTILNFPMPPLEMLSNIDQFMSNLEGAFELAPAGQFNPRSIPDSGDNDAANVNDLMCRNKCLEALGKLVTKESISQKINTIKKRLTDERASHLEACRTGILLQARYGQLPNQRATAVGLVNQALTKIQRSGILSSGTSQGFGRMIQENTDVEPSFPSQLLTGSDFLNAFSEVAANRVQPSYYTMVEMDMDVLTDLADTPGNLYGRDFRGCPSPRHLATDFFWPGIEKPLIHISPHSCAHPATGVAVVAHELGHALAHFISQGGSSAESTQSYLSRRQCVVGLSPILPVKMPDGAQQKFAMDRLTTEEDMADWVMQKASPFETHPSSCDFLKPTADGSQYDPGYLDVLPHEGDTHSGSLTRMIREWQAKHGSLPGSCQQLMSAHTGIVEARDCP